MDLVFVLVDLFAVVNIISLLILEGLPIKTDLLDDQSVVLTLFPVRMA